MRPRPAYFGSRYAASFQDHSVAAAYQYRPPYPPAVFEILIGLIRDRPRHVLDIGCGAGAIARRLVERVDHIDAVDVSLAMIEVGARLPHGDHPRLTWIAGRVEEAPLRSPYALITAGDSLHWMEWDVVLPRLQPMLTPRGRLALLTAGQLPTPWDAELLPLLQRYSLNQDYQPVDLVAELEQRGLFQPQGAQQTAPFRFTQSLDDYVESFHGRSSFSRERMGSDAAAAFDAEVRALVEKFAPDTVELQLVTDLVWGKPLQL